ncbi:hypothetical protein [Sphingomonas faeni]|uniref:hypothetical protein n=1 Tax=Sphingomonas faeni TaxID=185950 RepID=UPI0033445858
MTSVDAESGCRAHDIWTGLSTAIDQSLDAHHTQVVPIAGAATVQHASDTVHVR